MKGFHRISTDLREINENEEWPRWMWKSVSSGLTRFRDLLAAYDELQHRYPEEEE